MLLSMATVLMASKCVYKNGIAVKVGAALWVRCTVHLFNSSQSVSEIDPIYRPVITRLLKYQN